MWYIQVLVCLVPFAMGMSEEGQMDMIEKSEVDMDQRITRDAEPAVPAVIIKKVAPVPHPVEAAPVPLPVAVDAPHPAVAHPNPEYTPAAPVHVPTKAKCRIEEIQVEAEVCTPTLKKDCEKRRLVQKSIVDKEECFKIAKTVCSERIEEVESELCHYEYNMEEMEGQTKTVSVDYSTRCEPYSQNYCPSGQGSGYGYGHCKNVDTEVCHNEPETSEVKETRTFGYPVPNKVCETKTVSVPMVDCEDMEVEQCIQLPYTEDEKVELEACRAEAGPLDCQVTLLTLPKQICEELVEYVAPAPAYASPAPAYHAPAPAYHAPAPKPSYHAPAPAPAAGFHAPVLAAFTAFSG